MHKPSSSADTLAALLLTAHPRKGDEARPLTLIEYNKLAKWLKERSLRPSDVLVPRFFEEHYDLLEAGVESSRLQALVARHMAMMFDLDKWQQRGIWLVGRSDEAYPQRLRRTLRHLAPPVLFGVGDPLLVNRTLLCAVGSRKPTDDGLEFAKRLGVVTSGAGLGIISGVAAGVDREAMAGALLEGGFAVGVLAEGLMKPMSGRQNRELIVEGRLCLLSAYLPEDRWLAFRAMERNKVLYGASTAAVVVDSDIKGGTWEGARENLKHQWVPAGVRSNGAMLSGNLELLKSGLIGISSEDLASPEALQAWLDGAYSVSKDEEKDLFSLQNPAVREVDKGPIDEEPASGSCEGREASADGYENSQAEDGPLYLKFLDLLCDILRGRSLGEKEVAQQLDIVPAQARDWLHKAEVSGVVARKGRAKKYELLDRRLL